MLHSARLFRVAIKLRWQSLAYSSALVGIAASALAESSADDPPGDQSQYAKVKSKLPRNRFGLILGYGWTGSKLTEGDDPLRFGLGVRGGHLLGSTRAYLGGTAAFHFGNVGQAQGSAKLGYAMAELGYDAALGPISLLPYLGLGGAAIVPEGSSSGDASVGVSLAMGLSLQTIERGFCWGLDTRLLAASALLQTSEDTMAVPIGIIVYGFVGNTW